MTETRTAGFQRNELLERLLEEVNADMRPAEDLLLPRFRQSADMKYPLIMVMGPLRSGTTLFTQWLANTGLVAYPSNLLSRFYMAPIIGAKIQLMLTDPRYGYRDEMGDLAQTVEYTSENGKTSGCLAPNEFWYFWRRFLSQPSRDVWSDAELLESMDASSMRAELLGVMDVFDKPFAAKGMLFNYNIPFLNTLFQKVIFVHVRRNPIDNISSVLSARRRQLGDLDRWYSFKIPEYEELNRLTPIAQAAGQVYYINRAVTRGLKCVESSRKMVVNYDEFCIDPEKTFRDLKSKLGLSGVAYNGPANFSYKRAAETVSSGEIERELARFQSK